MPKVKLKRNIPTIDMTAMCDVAFLLLTFFILTATFRQPTPISIKLPTSTANTEYQGADLCTIIIGHGKVFFAISEKDIRMLTLKKMAALYKFKLNAQEIEQSSCIEAFGAPLSQIKHGLAKNNASHLEVKNLPGIPIDSSMGKSAELSEWIRQASLATQELHGSNMHICIKGDANEPYPTIKKIIGILQSQNINKFSLVTILKEKA